MDSVQPDSPHGQVGQSPVNCHSTPEPACNLNQTEGDLNPSSDTSMLSPVSVSYKDKIRVDIARAWPSYML